MGFRRRKEEDIHSDSWLIEHKSELVVLGLPQEVVNSTRNWNYVLLHGDHIDTGWSVDWMSALNAERLLDLLLSENLSETGHDIIRQLRERSIVN